MNSEIARLILYVIFGTVGALVGSSIWRSLKSRASAGDHVAATPRDVRIPDHCVSCGAPHASETIMVYPSMWFTRNSGIGDPRRVGGFPFRFCQRCAIPVRRHRRIGTVLLWLGTALVVSTFFVVFYPAPSSEHFYRFRDLKVDVMALTEISGIAVTFAGLAMRRHAAAVAIFDTGSAVIMFRFQNQIFRNHFAEMNPEVRAES